MLRRKKRQFYVMAFMDGCNFQTRIKNKLHHARCLDQAGVNAVSVFPFRFMKVRKWLRRRRG